MSKLLKGMAIGLSFNASSRATGGRNPFDAFLMFKKLSFLAFILIQVNLTQFAQAAFIFSEGTELAPLSQKSQLGLQNKLYEYKYSTTFHKLHELTKADQQVFFNGIDTGVTMIHVPQTCWDLFILHNDYRRMLPIKGIPFLKYQSSMDFSLNNDFINHIIKNEELFDHYINGRYSEISGVFLTEIRSHIKKFNAEVKKLFIMEGEIGDDCKTCIKIFGHSDTLFPEIDKLLIKATAIEQECYDADELPLWRHSRTTLKAPLDGNLENTVNTIIDLPIYQKITQKYNNNVKSVTKTLGIGTLCYGFSLLADFIGDGTIASIGDFKTTSACTMSYFMTELLSSKYASGTEFPFYIFKGWLGQEELKDSMKKETFSVTVTRFPKLTKSCLSEKLDQTWFIPEVRANDWVTSRGEESHPRHRGTHLNKDEESNKRNYQIKNIWNDNDLISVLKKFIGETNNMEILILNSQFCDTPELQEICTQLLQDRHRFSEVILARDDAAEYLKGFVMETYDCVNFSKKNEKK